MSLANALFVNSKVYLYKQVRDFIVNGHTKYLTESRVVDGYLIFSIGNEQSIHINPDLDLIVLVDDLVLHNENYNSAHNVRVLISFFTTISKKIDDFHKQFGSGLVGKITKKFNKLNLNPAAIFFESEIKYYKSLFSGHAGNYVYQPSGRYSFRLHDNKVLHFISDGEYLTDKGLYYISDPSKKFSGNTIEPDCTEVILIYLKELCKNPENLQNLATL